jgi:hypothetical protein
MSFWCKGWTASWSKVRNEVRNICLGKMASTLLMRRADLIAYNVIATANQDGEQTKVIYMKSYLYETKDAALLSRILDGTKWHR